MCGILGRRNRKTSSGLTQCRIFQSYPLQNKDPSGLGIKVRLRDAHRLTLPKASSSWATFKWGFKPKRVLGRCQDGWRFVRASQCEVFCEFAFCCGRLPSKCQPGRTILTFITVPWIYNKHGVRAAGCSAGQGPHCILPPRSHRSLGDIWPWRLTWKGRLDALPSSGAFASYRTKNALPKKGWCSHRILALGLVWDGGKGGLLLQSSEILTTVSAGRPHLHWTVCMYEASAKVPAVWLKKMQRGGKGPRVMWHMRSPSLHPRNSLDLCCWLLQHQDHGTGRQV